MDDISRNWDMLVGLLPPEWEGSARESRAVERLRGFASVDALLRCLLLHVGCGYSLRETSVRAEFGGFAQVSDVTLLNRLRQSEGWLQVLCRSLLLENRVDLGASVGGRVLRVVDGTHVIEPGKTGSQWRIHYSLRLPSLRCDHFVITAVKGKGANEKFDRFPAKAGELILGDRGFCRAKPILAVHRQGADVLVRVGTISMIMYRATGERFDMLSRLSEIAVAGQVQEWPVWIEAEGERLQGRLCAVRKSEEMVQRSLRRLHKHEQAVQQIVRPATRAAAAFVVVFTTIPATEASAAEILECYRLRWQIELVFKRLKSILQLGHLPKHDEQSSRAWLYGKLLIALLSEKIRRLGVTISPWGYMLHPQPPSAQPLA